MRLDACPACGAVGRTSYGTRQGLRLWRCEICGLIYSDPQPRGIVAERYKETYDLAQHFGALKERKTVLYERRFSWLPRPSSDAKRICDVGCADAQFLKLARERGWEPHGVEPNPPAAAAARREGVDVHEGWFEELEDLPWGTFDLVTAWDCIEHTPEPHEFAQRLVKLLRPGGAVALTTLNVQSLVARAFGMRWSMVVEDHYTYWDLSSLRSLMESVGLKVVEQHTFGLGRDFVTWIDRLAAGRPGGRAGGAQSPGPRTTGGWDARMTTIRVEEAVNAALDRTGTGVGQSLLAYLPE